MWCPRCGAETSDQARFCSTCGQDFATYQQMWQTQSSPAPGQAPQTAQAPPSYPAPPTYQGQQPQPHAWQGPRPHIPSHLAWSIVVLVLCFWPTGIPAVVYATQVDNKLAYGDVAGAWESSRKAKTWCWVSFGIFAGLILLWFLAFFFFCAVGTGYEEMAY